MSLSDVPNKSPNVRQDGYVGSDQVQRALDSLTRPLNASLAFLNAIFTGNASTPTLALSALSVTGAITAASAAISGAITGLSLTLSGAPTFIDLINTTAGVGNTYRIISSNGGNFNIQQNGTTRVLVNTVGVLGANAGVAVQGGSLTTVNGIKSLAGPWLYEHDSQLWGASTSVTCGWSYGAGTFATSIDNGLLMPFAGSVIGISTRFVSNGAAITPTIIVSKNGGTLDNSLTGAVPNSPNPTSLRTTIAKGVRTFAAGDVLSVSAFLNTAGFTAAITINVLLIVEMDA